MKHIIFVIKNWKNYWSYIFWRRAFFDTHMAYGIKDMHTRYMKRKANKFAKLLSYKEVIFEDYNLGTIW